MIKLIVSDMDGSLLTHEKQLPPDFIEVLNEMQRRGIVFAAASGRTYLTLLELFKGVSDKMNFISDNGTNLYIDGKCVHRISMPDGAWRRVAAVCENRPGVAAIINGANGDYVLPFKHDKGLEHIISGGFAALKEISCMSHIDDKIYKIGICDVNGPENGLYNDVCAVCGDELDAVISGPNYMDVMAKGASKGTALKILQQRLNISPDETMVFGDYYNDIGLFENATHSFVMSNAPADMLPLANNIAKSNDEYGVTEAIRSFAFV